LRIAGLILPDDGQISSIVAFDDEPIEHRIHAPKIEIRKPLQHGLNVQDLAAKIIILRKIRNHDLSPPSRLIQRDVTANRHET